MEPKLLTAAEVAERSDAAAVAIKIVRKFPQIERNVIAPALAVSIGRALLDFSAKASARNAALLAWAETVPHEAGCGRIYDSPASMKFTQGSCDCVKSKVPR